MLSRAIVSAFLLAFTVCIGHVYGNCNTSCTPNNHCYENLNTKVISYGKDHLCYTQDTCHGILGNHSKVPVQQLPIVVLENIDLIIEFRDFVLSDFTFSILKTSQFDQFITCNISNTDIVSYSIINNSSVQIPSLGVGIHYLIFKSNNILYSCQFGSRVQLTVYEQRCNFVNNTNPCRSNGRCQLNKTANRFECLCCNNYHGEHCQELDGCKLDAQPCSLNGECHDYLGGEELLGFNCSCNEQYTGNKCDQCIQGFTGNHCQTDINECNQTTKLCNFGQCINTNGSFQCVCPVNVTGVLCQTDTFNNCLSLPCNGTNRTCVDKYGSHKCICPADYTGQNCEVKIDNCADGSCDVDRTASCSDGFGAYNCNCNPGYTGVHCENNINDCASNNCENGGICIDLLDDFRCHCLPGYDGNRCQNMANKCETLKPCQNGTCERTGYNKRDYMCHCIAGFEGQNCTELDNKCRNFPCMNNATCNFLFNDYKCDCPLGWEGKNCSLDIDMCEQNPCRNNATCFDSTIALDYSCDCLAGFTDRNCSTNIDNCLGIDCNNGRCVDGIHTHHCKCDTGWYGKNCNVDKDYCALSPCINYIKCENVPLNPGFTCTCKSGFTGNSCTENINDCVNHTCQNNAVCKDLVNGYNCSCPPGFEGQSCEIDINECSSEPCMNNGTCQDMTNQFFCNCSPGFQGRNCELNIDECTSAPCKNNATCTDKINDFDCNCTVGFTAKDCGIHICTVNSTCLNGGRCLRTQHRDGFVCQCSRDFTGKHCELSVNECKTNQSLCQHNGTCVELHEGFRCDCQFPYNGTSCQTHICKTGVCQNNATCTQLSTGFDCICPLGFTGEKCEHNIDECLEGPCNTNGTIQCIDKINSCECQCYSAYLGKNCQNHLCDSHENLCNNGTCVPGKTGYNCTCFEGFTGANCSTNIDECANVTCQHNGTCLDAINNFTCVCLHPWAGRFCHEHIDICKHQDPCLNNGTCIWDLDMNSYACNCTFPFSGTHCQDHLCDFFNPCNNGTCIKTQSGTDGYSCQCQSGFTLHDCSVDINECETTGGLCQNGATCQNTKGSYLCECPSKYTGRNCETELMLCNLTSCSNGGVCINDYQNQTIKCRCLEDYFGPRCESRVSVCQQNNLTCGENGVCVDTGGNGTHVCNCSFGFQGAQCETFKCPCSKNGRCVRSTSDRSSKSQYRCICQNGYIGTHCEQFSGDCRSIIHKRCTLDSFCRNITGYGYACVCPPHLRGERCDKPGLCGYNPCQNNGSCISNDLGFQCNCQPGFTGAQCKFDLNECLSSPCQNGGVCAEDGINSFKCYCPMSYNGALCQQRIDGVPTTLFPSPSALLPSLASSLPFSLFSPSKDPTSAFVASQETNLSTQVPSLNSLAAPSTTPSPSSYISLEVASNGLLSKTTFDAITTTLKASLSTVDGDFISSSTVSQMLSTLSEPLTASSAGHGTASGTFLLSEPTVTKIATALSTPLMTSSAGHGSASGTFLLSEPTVTKIATALSTPLLMTSTVTSEAAAAATMFSAESYSLLTLLPSSQINHADSSLPSSAMLTFVSSEVQSSESTMFEVITSSRVATLSPSSQIDHANSSLPSSAVLTVVSNEVQSSQSTMFEVITSSRVATLSPSSQIDHANSSLPSSAVLTVVSKEVQSSESTMFEVITSSRVATLSPSSQIDHANSSPPSSAVLTVVSKEVQSSESTMFEVITSSRVAISEVASHPLKSTLLIDVATPSAATISQDVTSIHLSETASDFSSYLPQPSTSPLQPLSETIGNQLSSNLLKQSSPLLPQSKTTVNDFLSSASSLSYSPESTSKIDALTWSSERMSTLSPSSKLSESDSNPTFSLLTPPTSMSLTTSISKLLPSGSLSKLSVSKLLPSKSLSEVSESEFTIDPSSYLMPGESSTSYSVLSTTSSSNVMTSGTARILFSSIPMSDHSFTSHIDVSPSYSILSTYSIDSTLLQSQTIRHATMISSPMLRGGSSLVDSTLLPMTQSQATDFSSILTYTVKPTASTMNATELPTSSAIVTTPTTPTTTIRPYVNLACADDPCNGYECFNETDNGLLFRCQCPFPTVGPRCSMATTIHYPRFNGYSFLEIPAISLVDNKKDTIRIIFHTVHPDGLLMYAYNDNHGDHIQLFIKDGRLAVSMSTGGSDVVTMVTQRRVDSGLSLSAVVELDSPNRLVTLSIDALSGSGGRETISKRVASSLRSVQITSSWFLGGTPDVVKAGNTIDNFNGCIKELVVNNKPYRLADLLSARNWTNVGDCDVTLCDRHVCRNNASCIADVTNLENYECRCANGYRGPTCENKITDFCGTGGDVCHGGQCVWTANGRKCLCQYGRVGSSCMIDTIIVTPKFSTFLNFSSYLEYPWFKTGRTAKERFEIRFQFHVAQDGGEGEVGISSLRNSLLFYLGQSTVGAPTDDFLAIGVLQSHVYLIFNLGSGLTTIRSRSAIDRQRKWHFVVAGRTGQHGYLYVDSQDKVEASSPGSAFSLDAFTPLYLGGVPDFTRLPGLATAYFYQGFNGLIADVAFRGDDKANFVPLLTLTRGQVAAGMVGVPVEGGRNIANDGQDVCSGSSGASVCANGGTCQNTGAGFTCKCVPPFKGILCNDRDLLCVDYNPCSAGSACQSDGFTVRCDCPFGKKGQFCDEELNITIPYFTLNSYMALPQPESVSVRTKFILHLRFKADTGNGLLFYTGHSINNVASGDFLSISIWQRYIYVKFNLGTHTASMRMRGKITLQQWHSLYVRRENKEAVMRLDGVGYYVGVRASGPMSKLDVSTDFFLGGVPMLSGISSSALKDVMSQRDFSGCIEFLKIIGRIKTFEFQ